MVHCRKNWVSLRTINGIEFMSAEDNIVYWGALAETSCSRLGGHQLEMTRKLRGFSQSQAAHKDC